MIIRVWKVEYQLIYSLSSPAHWVIKWFGTEEEANEFYREKLNAWSNYSNYNIDEKVMVPENCSFDYGYDHMSGARDDRALIDFLNKYATGE